MPILQDLRMKSTKGYYALKMNLVKRISELTKKSNSQTEEIRSVYEEKLKTLADSKEQLLEEISNLKQQKTRVECTVHFKEEIGDCEERLRNISSEEKDTAVKVDRLKLECDRLRQKSDAETMVVEKEYDAKIDEYFTLQETGGHRNRIVECPDKQQQRLFLRVARQEQVRMAGKYR